MPARVVPVGYILTDEALRELVTTDPEWERLDAEWKQATGDAKTKARQDAHNLQDEITTKLFAAAKSRELPAIALKRNDAGEWTEHQLPDHYIGEIDGHLALWAGSVERMGLNSEDLWIADAPLCFRRVEFERWRRKPSAALSTPVQAPTMSSIIPVGYILTDEAIEELIGADPHFHRLKSNWLAATGQAKNNAYLEVCERQNQITDRLVEAVRSHQLQPLALQRTLVGEWVEHGIPKRYRETLGGELALWRGSGAKIELEPGDEWIRTSPLCFRRGEFNAWAGSTIVLLPEGSKDLPTWWTVPQAAVWIETRNFSKVQNLDDRARAWLMVADEFVPGAYTASFELLAGLRDARLVATGFHQGRPLRRSGADAIEPSFWKAPTEFSDGAIGVEAVRKAGDVRVGLLLESDDVMSSWEAPHSLVDGEKIPMGEFIGRLMHESWPAYLLRHPELVVTGLSHMGQRLEIDKDVFQTNARIDRASHSVRTADGQLHWSAVMVELRKTPEPAALLPAKDDDKRFIAFAQAARRVHRALCRDETITSLTSRERWLVKMDYYDAEMKDLAGEWQKAVNRDELWRHQCEEANDWLKSRGLVTGDDGLLDRVLFDTAFAVAFPGRPEPAVSSPETGKAVSLHASQQPTGFLDDRDIIALAQPVIARIVGDGRQLRRLDFEPLLRELTGDRLPPKAGDRLWPELARPEWRKSGKRPEGKLVDDWRTYLKPTA
jgi:hypothetical protein